MADLVFAGKPAGMLNSDAMPSSWDMVIYKGDYVDIRVTLKDSTEAVLNLTGYSAAAKLKEDYDAPTSIPFTVTITDPTQGKVRIYLPTATSKTLVPGSYIWDFEVINPDGDARTFLAGDVTVYNEVT